MTRKRKHRLQIRALSGARPRKKKAGDPSKPEGSNSESDVDSAPVLDPKHDVFLSHSGKQKDFTELLCKELESWGYSPFFDVREDSLPKGKRFPELIFSAARQCRVAILILSEEFFTNSKWPMLELAAFVNAQKEFRQKNLPEVSILPVYLRLSRKECTEDERRRSKWLSLWKGWQKVAAVKGDRPIDVHEWEFALELLGPANGIEYKQSSREAGLIDEVVKAVRHLLPPPTMASDASIHGKGRICETIMEKISKTKVSSNGARVVGVYGMGGIGKTTFCKELCYRYYKEFEGKVCHAELESKSKSELQKDVVRTLTNVNHGSLSLVHDSKVTEHLENRMAGERVFLALDNVWLESREEATIYVRRARYGHDSILLVTARSIDMLTSLKIDESDCLEMPELEEEDARQLFLYHAAPGIKLSQFQSDKDKWSIEYCIKECRFSKGEGRGVHFHPLALKVLGSQLKSVGYYPEKWVESLSEGSKFDQDRQKEHPIFAILGRGYDMLREEDRLLFMDVVLFHPSNFERFYTVTCFEWLHVVHGSVSDMASIEKRLQGLKARALLEDIGIGVGRVIVHDLYREFARFEANRGKLEDRSVMWHAERETITPEFEKTPQGGPDGCWSNVERVGVDSFHGPIVAVGGVKWQHFANVVILFLRNIKVNQVLDLRGLRRLRSLTLMALRIKVVGLGELRNLRWLDLDGIRCGHHEIGHLTELQVLRVITECECVSRASQPLELANLDKCINLRELEVRCACLKALPDLSHMTSLRRAIFECPNATDGPGLGSRMCALEDLRLVRCRSLCRLPCLGKAVSLQVLKITNDPYYRNYKVEQFPEIRTLTRLRQLEIRGLYKLSQLPELGELVALEVLVIESLPQVQQLPDMVKLTKLRRLELIHIAGHLSVQPGWVGLLPSQLRYLKDIVNCSGCYVEEMEYKDPCVDEMFQTFRLPRRTNIRCGILLDAEKRGSVYGLDSPFRLVCGERDLVDLGVSRKGKERAILDRVSHVGISFC